MSAIQSQRAKLSDLWAKRHYYPEQGFDLLYLDELNALRKLEAAAYHAKAQHYAAMAEQYQASIDQE